MWIMFCFKSFCLVLLLYGVAAISVFYAISLMRRLLQGIAGGEVV